LPAAHDRPPCCFSEVDEIHLKQESTTLNMSMTGTHVIYVPEYDQRRLWYDNPRLHENKPYCISAYQIYIIKK